jgi:addiction module RelE/StbE family toxin
MKVRWSPAAADDLEHIVEHIRKENPDAAQRLAQDIYKRVGTLATFPNLGRPGRVYGTRELPVPPLPFIVVYRVLEHADAVEIANILHGAQLWPPLP